MNSSADGPKSVAIEIVVDSSGNLIGGTSGDDLVIIGAIDQDGDSVADFDGVLLTGEVVAFGFQDSGGPTDDFDFVFIEHDEGFIDLLGGQHFCR